MGYENEFRVFDTRRTICGRGVYIVKSNEGGREVLFYYLARRNSKKRSKRKIWAPCKIAEHACNFCPEFTPKIRWRIKAGVRH